MNVLCKPMQLLLFYVVFHSVIFRCSNGETRVKVKVKLKEYKVNGKDWNNKDCDYVIRTECDPMFLICVDKPSGDSNANNCAYTKKGWSSHYQGQDEIWFGDSIGNSIDNPVTTTIKDWKGSFRFKVYIQDHDSGSGHDDIDKFNHLHQDTPGRSSSEASWDTKTLTGRRSNNPSKLKIEVQLYCETDWFTEDCSVYCTAKDNDIDGHYTCDADTGQKLCRTGWETPEENCLVKIDDCEDHNCVNGATCVDAYKSYTCDCMAGYTGVHCEVNIDECDSSPCLNTGQCLDQVDYFHCICSDPYTGDLCQYHVCSVENYCENGGTCYDDQLGNVSCICTHPYVGRHCDVDKCDILECENGGTCINGSCVCPPNYLGNLCEFLFCDQITCDNGGTCVGNACVCPPGYTGRYCHININYCESDPCQNDGSCLDYINGYECSCLPGYNGTHCQYKLPSRNDGESQELRATSTSEDGTPGWHIGLIVVVIAFVVFLVIAIAVLVTRRRQKKKEPPHSPSTVTSDSREQSSFPNPLYNTDIGGQTNDRSLQAGVLSSSCSIETTTEKVPFPDLEKTLSPPPPYTLHENYGGDFDTEPIYIQMGSARQPPLYCEAADRMPAKNNHDDNDDNALPSYGASAAPSSSSGHYDNPRKLFADVGSSAHIYDSPKKVLSSNKNGSPSDGDNSNEVPHYEVVKASGEKAVKVQENPPQQSAENNVYSSIDAMRGTSSIMDDSVHNNSTNEMLERDNEGFQN